MKNTNMHSPGEQKTYLPTEGNQLRYLLYLPPKFSDLPDRSWPVICFLHGIGEAAKNSGGADQSIEVLLNHGAPPWHCEINSPLIQDFIVLSPQLPTRRSWEEGDLGEVSKILKTLYKSFRGNRDKSYLTGFSIGGRGVFDFVVWGKRVQEKEDEERLRWAALWPVDDANDQPRASCDIARIWLHFGTWKPGPQNSTARNLRLQEVKAFRNGYPTVDRLYTDYSPFGYSHGPTCAAAYADSRVYEWLLRT
jgi:hypothetical protein